MAEYAHKLLPSNLSSEVSASIQPHGARSLGTQVEALTPALNAVNHTNARVFHLPLFVTTRNKCPRKRTMHHIVCRVSPAHSNACTVSASLVIGYSLVAVCSNQCLPKYRHCRGSHFPSDIVSGQSWFSRKTLFPVILTNKGKKKQLDYPY